MPSLRYLWPLVVVAACDSRTQLDVVVDTSQLGEVDEVRVYLGKNQSNVLDISLTQVDMAMAGRRKGQYYLMDRADAHDRISGVTPGDVVTFVFTPPDESADIDTLAVIAVGFSNGVPNSFARSLGVTFVQDRVLEDELVLQKAAAGSDFDDNIATRQVVVWRPENQDDDCVQTLDTADSRTPSVFIVRSELDKDCDGYDRADPLECTATSYLGTARGGPDDVACVTSATTGANCHVGTIRCEDGVPKDPATCGRSGVDYFCTSGDTCLACLPGPGNGGAEPNGWPCDPQGVDHSATCTVPVLPGQGLGNINVCLPMVLNLAIPPVPGLSCDDDENLGAYNPTNAGGRWQSKYELNNLRMTFHRSQDCSATVLLEQIDDAQPISLSTIVDMWVALPMNVENKPSVLGVIGAMRISFDENGNYPSCPPSVDCLLAPDPTQTIKDCLLSP